MNPDQQEQLEPPPLPLVPYDPDHAVAEAGAVKNTLLGFAAQLAGLVCTGGLTLYLVRALGPRSYGVYALAVSIGTLAVFPALWGLPFAIGRFLADHRGSSQQARQIFKLGIRLQVPASAITALALFALAGPIADAYGSRELGWPLRWVALSVIGQALFSFLGAAGISLRRSSPGLWMALIESTSEATTSVALVVAGGGAAGAAFGKLVGYTVAIAAGLVLVPRIFGDGHARVSARIGVTVRSVMRYASVMFVVDVTWAAISQVDIVLIGAILSTTAVGSFGAVLRILTVLGYVGSAVSAGVTPRLSLGGDGPDVRVFELALRYLMIVQGVTLAPMLAWAGPITHLLLGGGYGVSAQIMRALSLYSFVGAPASMVTLAVNYLGESRRRLVIMIATFGLGLVATYVLLRVMGVVGAAVADDLIILAYVGAHFWICTKLIKLDLRALSLSLIRTLVAAATMGAVLVAIGTENLSAVQWIAGLAGGFAAYAAAMIATREVSVAEITALAGKLRGPTTR